MIKVLNQYFPRRWAVLLIGESMLILAALATAVTLNNGGWPGGATTPGIVLKAVLITCVCQLCLHYSDLYSPQSHASGQDVLSKLLQALGIASLILALVYWLLPQARLSTGLVVGSVLGLLVILMGWRRAMDAAMSWAHRAYPSGERILVLGSGNRAQGLLRELRQRPQLDLNLLGVVADTSLASTLPDPLAGGVPFLGGLDQLGEVIAAQRPRRIVLALDDSRHRMPCASLISARASGIQIVEAPTLLERISGRLALDSIRPSWLILSDGFRKPFWLRFYQRTTSLLAATAGLIALSPVMAIVAVAIKLDSRGPVIYKQERVGLNGRRFNIYKFRSMRADAEEQSGPVWAQAQDPRITRLGRWLRKLRLDEVPQLWNVLQGTMSIVGPRPERPQFVEDFRREIPYYEMRHSVRPGITGWAQVSRDYGASLEDAREKLEYDLFYIKNLSVWLDLFILFQTTKIIALGRGAR